MPKLSPNWAKNGHFSELFRTFSRVETSSAKARKTRLDSNFVNSQLPKLAKTKISVKTVFRRALTVVANNGYKTKQNGHSIEFVGTCLISSLEIVPSCFFIMRPTNSGKLMLPLPSSSASSIMSSISSSVGF